MAITMIGSGGIFTRFGKLAGYAKTLRTLQKTTIATEVDDVLGAFSDADKDQVSSLLSDIDQHRTFIDGALVRIFDCARLALIEQVHADHPLDDKTLAAALAELRIQMAAGSDDIDAPTVSASVAAGSGSTGNGKLIVATVDERANTLQHLRAEVIRVQAMTDRQDGETRAGLEVWSVRGQAAVGNRHWNWPAGSGVNGRIFTTNPEANGAYGPGAQLLRNGGFENFTSNAPDWWTIGGGLVAVTHYDDSTTNYHRGAKSLAIIGDGAVLHSFSQAFNTTSATAGVIRAQAKICTSFWTMHDGVAPGAGILRLSVRDGSGNEIGGSNVTVDLTASLSSSWQHFSHTWATPFPIPSGAKFVIETTTALSAGRTIFLDDVVCAEMHRPDPGGIYYLLVPGATDWAREDYFDVTVANNRAAGVAAEMCLELDRFFDCYGLRIQWTLDTGGAETVLDSLIS